MRKILAVLFVVGLFACNSDSKNLLGEPCKKDSQCEDDVCLLDLTDLEFPNGMCSAECSEDEWGDYCVEAVGEVDSWCLRHTYSGQFLCLPECDSDADCRDDEGYVCTFVGYDVYGDFLTVCIPHANSHSNLVEENVWEASQE